MIVVTGAAGFIGSCVVSRLNKEGFEDLILVDHINGIAPNADNASQGQQSLALKKENLKGKKYRTYREKKAFLDLIARDQLDKKIKCIIHMGACSSTTLQDAKYFEENNFEYTLKTAQWALKNNVRFIYASSATTYGDGAGGYRDDDASIRRCKPLNLYGQSKQKFDLWALDQGVLDKIVGIKFFNVFGPNEYHKGDMRSVVSKSYDRVVREGKMALFKSYHKDYQDGEQKRDFIYVKDAVDVVLFFFKNTGVNGIFNLGTGEARTWNDLANGLFKAVGKKPSIEYVPMPENLQNKYQYFTQADMSKLRRSGYTKPFTSLEDAVLDYAGYLKDHRHL